MFFALVLGKQLFNQAGVVKVHQLTLIDARVRFLRLVRHIDDVIIGRSFGVGVSLDNLASIAGTHLIPRIFCNSLSRGYACNISR